MSSAFRAENLIRWPLLCPMIHCPHHVSALDCADDATGFWINPLSCASPLGHPRFLCRPGSLVSLGREPSRRSLRRNFLIDRLAAQDREGDARHLVGERHGDKLERLLLDQLLGPTSAVDRCGTYGETAPHARPRRAICASSDCPSSKCARASACRRKSSAWASGRDRRRTRAGRRSWTYPEWSPPSPRR